MPAAGMMAGAGRMLILSTQKAERKQEGNKGPHLWHTSSTKALHPKVLSTSQTAPVTADQVFKSMSLSMTLLISITTLLLVIYISASAAIGWMI